MTFSASLRCGEPIGPPRSSLNKYVTRPPFSVSRVSVTASEHPVIQMSSVKRTSGPQLTRQREPIALHDLLSRRTLHIIKKLSRRILMLRSLQYHSALLNRGMGG